MQEGIFDEVAQLVECFVVRPGLLAVLARRNHDLHTLRPGFLHEGVAVVALVSQQAVHPEAVDQPLSLRTICSGTFCNKRSERQTMRIHGQMYLGVEPPFVRLMA